MSEPMTEARLVRIEAQTKSLRMRPLSRPIRCNDGQDRYGDEDLQIFHTTDVNVPELIAEVRRLQRENQLLHLSRGSEPTEGDREHALFTDVLANPDKYPEIHARARALMGQD